jgi:hypothetical protein
MNIMCMDGLGSVTSTLLYVPVHILREMDSSYSDSILGSLIGFSMVSGLVSMSGYVFLLSRTCMLLVTAVDFLKTQARKFSQL